jgi:hypothetical protein
MGFSLSWLGIKGKSATAILAELRLRPTGAPGVEGESSVVGAMSDAGWYLIVARGAEHRLISAPVVERLSTGCEVLTCTVEEHVMFSEATGWQNGRRVWSVTHRAEDGPTGIDAQGALPPEFPPIRDDFTARQRAEGGDAARVDFLFEIPVALVERFIAYRHDAISPAFDEESFEVLVPMDESKQSWIQRLFGSSVTPNVR